MTPHLLKLKCLTIIIAMLTSIFALILILNTTTILPDMLPYSDKIYADCNIAEKKRLVKPFLFDLAHPEWNFCGNDDITLVLNNLKNPTNHSHPKIFCPGAVKIINLQIDPFMSGEFDSILTEFPKLDSLTLLGPIRNMVQCSPPKFEGRRKMVLPISSLRLVDTSFCTNLFGRMANKMELPCLQDVHLECSHPFVNETEGSLMSLKALENYYPSLKTVHYESTTYPGVEQLTREESHVELCIVYNECF